MTTSVPVFKRRITPRAETVRRQRPETREEQMIEALSPHLNLMVRAARRAGSRMIRDFGEIAQLQVSRKGPGDFVTNADVMAEKTLISFLSEARPDYGFISEESGVIEPKNDSPFTWIIDPIDGTINFLHAINFFAVSIGLAYKGDIVAGVVYNPITNQLYYAEKSKGAFLMTPTGNVRLRVSGRTHLEDALIASNAFKTDRNAKVMPPMAADVSSVRYTGSAALSLAMVAAGQLEAYIATQLKIWDIAAGILLVQEAGGFVADFNGSKKTDDMVKNGNMIAANLALKDAFLKKVKEK